MGLWPFMASFYRPPIFNLVRTTAVPATKFALNYDYFFCLAGLTWHASAASHGNPFASPQPR